MDKYKNICLWSFFIDGVVKEASTVHHIIEILKDESKAFDLDNLIPLSEYNHSLIHQYYKTNYKECIGLLRTIKDKELIINNLGMYKVTVREWN